MSITKGAMLISNANAVGAELVNQLGGTGYKPVEWADKINLLGINSVDAPYAIKSIQAGTYTGEERGAIQYSNCNAVGSMLNKKLNTNRGFKPVEWESAISKLTPLAEGTVSGSVVSIENGADDVPTKSLVVTIPPTLSGVSVLNETQTGRNLLVNNIEDGATGGITYTKNSDGSISCSGTVSNVNSTRLISTQVLPIGSYILSGADSSINLRAVLYDSNGSVITNRNDTGSGVTISVDSTVSYVEIRIKARTNSEQVSTTISPMLAVGSTVQTYEPYNGTQYTASLGRTIYGGQADIVNGVGTSTHGKVTLTAEMINNAITYTYQNKIGVQIGNVFPVNVIRTGNHICSHATVKQGASSDSSYMWFGSATGNKYLYWIGVLDTMDMTLEQWKTWALTQTIVCVYEEPTATDFTFDGQEINTRLGYNAFWSDQGDTEVTYYQAPTALTRSTVSEFIASFSDADTRLTCVNAIATIPPSITGVDTVQLVDAGVNLWGSDKDLSITRDKTIYMTLPAGSYVLSFDFISSTADPVPSYLQVAYSTDDGTIYNPVTVVSGRCSRSFTLSSNARALTIYASSSYYASVGVTTVIQNIQLEVGSTGSAYTSYIGTTYTANLPSTNYGGSVDFVNGDVVKSYNNDIMTSTYLSGLGIDTYIGYEAQTAYFNYHPSIWVRNWHYQDAKARQTGGIGCVCNYFPVSMHNTSIFSSQYRIYFDVDGKNISSVADFIAFVQNIEANNENLKITYELATPTNASITGQAIIPKTGTNNCYNNVGGNTEITYFTNT